MLEGQGGVHLLALQGLANPETCTHPARSSRPVRIRAPPRSDSHGGYGCLVQRVRPPTVDTANYACHGAARRALSVRAPSYPLRTRFSRKPANAPAFRGFFDTALRVVLPFLPRRSLYAPTMFGRHLDPLTFGCDAQVRSEGPGSLWLGLSPTLGTADEPPSPTPDCTKCARLFLSAVMSIPSTVVYFGLYDELLYTPLISPRLPSHPPSILTTRRHATQKRI